MIGDNNRCCWQQPLKAGLFEINHRMCGEVFVFTSGRPIPTRFRASVSRLLCKIPLDGYVPVTRYQKYAFNLAGQTKPYRATFVCVLCCSWDPQASGRTLLRGPCIFMWLVFVGTSHDDQLILRCWFLYVEHATWKIIHEPCQWILARRPASLLVLCCFHPSVRYKGRLGLNASGGKSGSMLTCSRLPWVTDGRPHLPSRRQ